MTKKIDLMAAHTGRFLKEDDTAVNMADILAGTGSKVATIALGASESGAIDLEGYQLSALFMPSAWDAANITYLSAPTIDGTYLPVYDDYGNEATAIVDANTSVTLARLALVLAPLRFIKLRSGTAATPVNQTADRVITLSLKR